MGWTTKESWFNSRKVQDRLFPPAKRPDRLWGPTQFPTQWVGTLSSSRGRQPPVRSAYHSPPSSPAFNRLSHTSTSAYAFMARIGTTYNLLIPQSASSALDTTRRNSGPCWQSVRRTGHCAHCYATVRNGMRSAVCDLTYWRGYDSRQHTTVTPRWPFSLYSTAVKRSHAPRTIINVIQWHSAVMRSSAV
jgi:hypothetical protein